MRRIELPGTDLEASVLGFGCSALMGVGGKEQRQALLGHALDAGVTHFDVARLYGLGHAESELGDFVAQHRDQVTVATKFGIDPMPMPVAVVSRGLSKIGLKGLGRKVDAAGVASRTHLFSVVDARSALDSSLRNLRTDTIDLYLLHDCNEDDVRNPELLAFLEEAKKVGKIRAFGVGTDIGHVLEIDRTAPEYTRVVQFQNSVVSREMERLASDDGRAAITHRALSGNFTALGDWLDDHPDVRREWEGRLGLDLTGPGRLADAMLAYALATNPRGIVLFSTTKAERIDANVRTADAPLLDAERAGTFARLVAEAGI